MKITSEKLEISPEKEVAWENIKTMRLLNNKLALELEDDQVIELSNLRLSTIDLVFRTYEKYLKDHPEKRKPPKSRK